MNTISKLIIASFLSLGLFIIQSCVKDDDYSIPSVVCSQKATVTTTITELIELVNTNALKTDEKGFVSENLVIEGVVNVSDESGNISNTISFQDKSEEATAGMQIELGERSLYGVYPIGSTVQIHLKNLKVVLDRGLVKIGTKLEGDDATSYDLDRIPKEVREKVLIKTCDAVKEIKPKEVNSIKEALNQGYVNTLVKIKNVQFKSPETAITYYPSGATSSVGSVVLVDSNENQVNLRISKYAAFKDDKLPTNSGDITVLVSYYKSGTSSEYQLYIRDTNDVNFTLPRFDGSSSNECTELITPNIILSELINKVEKGRLVLNSDKTIAEDLYVHGYIISSDETGNFFKTISLQDSPQNPTAGIQIEIDQSNLYTNYPLGSKVQVNLKGLFVASDKGVYKIGIPNSDGTAVSRIPSADIKKYLIKSCDPVQTIVPRVVSNLSDLLNPAFINTLITVADVQFKNPTTDKTYGVANTTVNRLLEDKLGNTLDLRNSGYSKWYKEALPTASGSITFVLGRYNTSFQAFIRDTNDVNFNNARFESFDNDVDDLDEVVGTLENFESARKTNYALGDVTLSTGIWTINDGGIFAATEIKDLKSSGTGSVRLRGSSSTEGYIQSKFYAKGLKTLRFYFGGTNFDEGTDSDKEIKIEVLISTNAGSSWKSLGEKIGESGKMNLVEFPVNSLSTDKVLIKLVNKSYVRYTKNRVRINVDDVEFIK